MDTRIEQFVMAYGVEQDRVRALLPEGFESLRPVLRINEEIAAQYEKQPLTAEHAAAIPCRQVLGACIVRFERCCEQYAK